MEMSLKKLSTGTVTELELINYVAGHLHKQGVPCQVDVPEVISCEPRCSYRDGEGRSCAAGCLMTDAEYEELNERHNIEGRTWKGLSGLLMVPTEHAKLIEELQSIHDSHSVEEWPHKLGTLLQDRDLPTDKITELWG